MNASLTALIQKTHADTEALAQRFDEAATAAVVLNKPQAMSLEPGHARDLAELMRCLIEAADTALALAQALEMDLAIERDVRQRVQQERERIEKLSLFGLVSYWLKARRAQR